MMWAIEARGLGKQYVRGAAHHRRFHTLRDVLAEWGSRVILRQSSDGGADTERFWALTDVSFEIEPGEVVGIIGRNGSGKSTLLKIISQITAPTAGEVRLRGRTGTLLEIGTGFHPELTGRENIFLNGTILGMHRAEIAQKFDEIVAFSGVEDFIDTPVKRYSSGMQMRLAFAVAAHLDPEILIVDEVLAVGDVEFQKKCLGKIQDVSRGGRTVLFVSHNMSAIDQLCGRVIWLDHGRLVEDSTDTHAVTSRYLFGNEKQPKAAEWRASSEQRVENEYFSLHWFRVRDAAGDTIDAPIRNDGTAIVEIGLSVRKPDPALTFGYALTNEAGVCVYWSSTEDAGNRHRPQLSEGNIVLTSALPQGLMNQGLFRLDFMSAIRSREWLVNPNETRSSVFLRISGLEESQYLRNNWPGVLAPALRWNLEQGSREKPERAAQSKEMN
jgi:lipopolysaccharide transport system ATP-binding protein